MMRPVEIKPDVYSVGVVDWNIRDFHGYSIYKGTTYNSYLVIDDKVTLFDTVKKPFFDQLLHRIQFVIDPEKIDYLVVNHVELDHSGSLPETLEAIKPEKVFCSPMGKKNLEEHFRCDGWPLEVVKSGDTINLGRRSVHFLETRMLHWPDSMFSYIPEEKLLISSDAFGQHWATSETFDDEVSLDELRLHAAKYYANILYHFSPLVQKLLATVKKQNLQIDMIAPDHGLVWRSHVHDILDSYHRWSLQKPGRKALIVYDTMWHSTEKMAYAIASGLADEGLPYKIMKLSVTHRSDVMTEVLDSGALILGSPTLNNGILPTVADMLCYIKGLRPANKVGTAFGSFGWSGEAVKIITKALEEMKIDVVDPGIRSKFVPDHETLKACADLGRRVARLVKERAA